MILEFELVCALGAWLWLPENAIAIGRRGCVKMKVT
jgi:hypothetical protein